MAALTAAVRGCQTYHATFAGCSISRLGRSITIKPTNKHSPETREEVVRPAPDNPGQHESQLPASLSISSGIGYASKTLNAVTK